MGRNVFVTRGRFETCESVVEVSTLSRLDIVHSDVKERQGETLQEYEHVITKRRHVSSSSF